MKHRRLWFSEGFCLNHLQNDTFLTYFEKELWHPRKMGGFVCLRYIQGLDQSLISGHFQTFHIPSYCECRFMIKSNVHGHTILSAINFTLVQRVTKGVARCLYSSATQIKSGWFYKWYQLKRKSHTCHFKSGPDLNICKIRQLE